MVTEQASLTTVIERMGWPRETAAHLAMNAHVISHGRRATVFQAGEVADLTYVLLSGEVKLYYGTDDGMRILVGFAHAGEILGAFSLDEQGGPEQVQIFTAETISRCDVAIIARTRVIQSLHELPPPVVLRIMARRTDHWTRLSSRLLAFLTMTMRARLLYALTELADGFGIPDGRGRIIPLRLSHEDFAELVGASRPVVSKHLKDLAAAGTLTKVQGRYVVARQVFETAHSGFSRWPGSSRAAGQRKLTTLRVAANRA